MFSILSVTARFLYNLSSPIWNLVSPKPCIFLDKNWTLALLRCKGNARIFSQSDLSLQCTVWSSTWSVSQWGPRFLNAFNPLILYKFGLCLFYCHAHAAGCLQWTWMHYNYIEQSINVKDDVDVYRILYQISISKPLFFTNCLISTILPTS